MYLIMNKILFKPRLVMPMSDTRDRVFYTHYTPMKDTHSNINFSQSGFCFQLPILRFIFHLFIEQSYEHTKLYQWYINRLLVCLAYQTCCTGEMSSVCMNYYTGFPKEPLKIHSDNRLTTLSFRAVNLQNICHHKHIKYKLCFQNCLTGLFGAQRLVLSRTLMMIIMN